jgi:N-acylneuraminate cytidylyltransferase
MMVTALVPMKGHSERIRNKNMKRFSRRPLCAAILETLGRCRYVSGILVDTDSAEIAGFVKRNFRGAVVIKRPEKLRGDFVSMNRIIAYDISRSADTHFLQTHCTNPVLRSLTIDKAVSTYFVNLKQYDSLFSVTGHRTRFYDSRGVPVNHNPERLIRTQDLAPLYEENSNIYIFSRKSFEASDNRRIGKRPYMFETDKYESIDIDGERDFAAAKVIKSNVKRIL